VLLRSLRPLRTATHAEVHSFDIFYTTEIIFVSNEQKAGLVADIRAGINFCHANSDVYFNLVY
jgi:hypothetical protein